LRLRSKPTKNDTTSIHQEIQKSTLPTLFYLPGSHPSIACEEALRTVQKKGQIVKQYPSLTLFFQSQTQAHLPPCLFVVSLENQTDALEITQLMDELEKRNWHWQSQFILISAVDHPKLCSYFVKRNCMVVSKRLSTPRGISERIERQISLLQLIQLGAGSDSLLEIAHRIKPSLPFLVEWTQPLLLEEDIWFIPTERFVYKDQNFWTLVLHGPNPITGEWVATENYNWKWISKSDQPSNRQPEDEGWHFEGNKPSYHGNSWKFTGQAPYLYFLSQKKAKFIKFITKGSTQIEVSPNSSYLSHKLRQNIRGSDLLKPTMVPSFHQTQKKSSSPEFRPIDDALLFREFLNQAIKNQSNFLIWQKNNKMRISGTLTSMKRDGSKISVQLTDESWGFIERRGEFAGEENYFGNFNTDQGCAFFCSSRIAIDHNTKAIILFPDQAFFYVQRREHRRIKPGSNLTLKITPLLTSLEIHNLSADGISIKIKRSDYENFKANPKKELALNLNGQIIQCDLVPRWTKDLTGKDHGFVLAGFRYSDISEIDQQTLQLFIFEQTQEI